MPGDSAPTCSCGTCSYDTASEFGLYRAVGWFARGTYHSSGNWLGEYGRCYRCEDALLPGGRVLRQEALRAI